MRARVMALSGASGRQPKPSRMTSTTGRTAGRNASDAGFVSISGGAIVVIVETVHAAPRRRSSPSVCRRLGYYFTYSLLELIDVVAPIHRKELDARRDARCLRRDAGLAFHRAPLFRRPRNRNARRHAAH